MTAGSSSGLCRRPARLCAGRLRRCCWLARSPACAARRRPPAPAAAEPPRVADRRRLRRGGRDRREGRQRAGARLPARAPRGDRRLRRLAPTTPRAGPRGRRRPRARAPARRQDPRPGRGRRPRPRRDRRLLRRQRALGARRPARAGRRRSPTRASATSAARCGSSTPAAARTRRACTGATRWRCARWSRGWPRSPAGNGAIYATRREAYLVVDPVMGHDLSFPFNMVKRGWRRGLRPGRAATEKMVPSIEGEFARKRRMMSHAWPIVLRGGMLSPRGYGAAVRADDRLAPRPALRHAVPAPRRARRPARALVAAGAAVRRRARAAAGAAARRGARRACSRRARCWSRATTC